MDSPLVTVITVTRNRADLLGRCIRSIQSQTYVNFEHIIVDGASTDNTEQVVKSFNDGRIQYIKTSEEQSGYAECYDIAFSHIKGKYLCFLDDDDEYLPTKIEKQVSLIERLPEEYGLVYCWMTYYDTKTGKEIRLHNPQLKGDVSLDVIEKPTVSGTPTFLIRTDAFLKVGGWVNTTETGVASDWAFAALFCQQFKVDYVPESLIKIYVNHGHLRMTNARNYYTGAAKKMIKLHTYFLKTYEDIFQKYPDKAWYHYQGLVKNNILIGSYKESKEYYKQLLKFNHSLSTIILPYKTLLKKLLKWK